MARQGYNASDAGCIADGGHGHQHVRSTMADWLNALDLGKRLHAERCDIVASLRAPMPDDAWDEWAGIELLNVLTHGATWELVDGNLMLTAD